MRERRECRVGRDRGWPRECTFRLPPFVIAVLALTNSSYVVSCGYFAMILYVLSVEGFYAALTRVFESHFRVSGCRRHNSLNCRWLRPRRPHRNQPQPLHTTTVTSWAGSPREGRGYVAILPRFRRFLNFSLCWALGTPKKAGVLSPFCPNMYTRLAVQRGAVCKEILAAYKQKLLQPHPNKNIGWAAKAR